MIYEIRTSTERVVAEAEGFDNARGAALTLFAEEGERMYVVDPVTLARIGWADAAKVGDDGCFYS